MKVGLVITMYNESDIVKQTISNCLSSQNSVSLVVVHSDNDESSPDLDYIKNNSCYILLENLGKTLDKYELPSASLCRNYSVGFTKLYELQDYDVVIGIIGDTLITDLDELLSSVSEKYDFYALQAIGQRFNAATDDPKNGVRCNRLQHENITDLMPQIIIMDGKIALENKLLSQIENFNRFTTEQNLGDTILKSIPDFKSRFKKLNEGDYVYGFEKGVKLQARGQRETYSDGN